VNEPTGAGRRRRSLDRSHEGMKWNRKKRQDEKKKKIREAHQGNDGSMKERNRDKKMCEERCRL